MKTMTANNRNILESNSDVIALRVFFVMVFVLLCCSGVFGQNNPTAANDAAPAVKVEATGAAVKMDMVKWFMGSGPVRSTTPEAGSTKTSAKKAIINSGITPNRILSRTLLKKAMEQGSDVA